MGVEGDVVTWVADHRKHHQFSDRPGDPHSPHADYGDGALEALKGLWHAHTGLDLLGGRARRPQSLCEGSGPGPRTTGDRETLRA